MPPQLRETIVARVQESFSTAPPEKQWLKNSCTRVVIVEREKYKVRWYENEVLAQRAVGKLLPFQSLFAPFCGRCGPFLVFRFVENNPPASKEQVLTGIGWFLAKLREALPPVCPQDPFNAWCTQIESTGIFCPDTVHLIRKVYCDARPSKVDYSYEYLDALPHNFAVVDDGRLICIDEKHLCVAAAGLSLMKPMYRLSSCDFSILLARYPDELRLACLDADYVRFLKLNYLVYCLAAHGDFKPLAMNRRIRMFHVRRQQLLELIHAPFLLRVREVLKWRVLFEIYNVYAELSRLIKKRWHSRQHI